MKTVRFEWNRFGITREVFLVGRYAIKIPTWRYGWRFFIEGVLSNLREQEWSSYEDVRLCPILFADPLGLFVIMPRCERILDDAEIDYSRFQGLPADDKPDNYGLLNGDLVKLDYGA